MCGRATSRGSSVTLPAQEPEAGGGAELVAAFEEQLVADADAEQLSAVGERAAQGALELAAQPLARRPESADAGQHDPARGAHG